jgi:hypothetical protein
MSLLLDGPRNSWSPGFARPAQLAGKHSNVIVSGVCSGRSFLLFALSVLRVLYKGLWQAAEFKGLTRCQEAYPVWILDKFGERGRVAVEGGEV